MLFVVLAAGPTTDEMLTIVFSVLGGTAGVCILALIILPRILGSSAAAGANVVGASARAAAFSPMVRAAKPRPYGIRWTPAYGGDVATRPGREVDLEKAMRVSAAPNSNSQLPPNQVLPNQVSQYCNL